MFLIYWCQKKAIILFFKTLYLLEQMLFPMLHTFFSTDMSCPYTMTYKSLHDTIVLYQMMLEFFIYL